MNVLWIAAAGMCVATLAALLAPLALRTRRRVPGRAEFDLTVYKDQLTEVDRDLERGLLSADQAISARTEIERRMLDALDDVEATAERAAGTGPSAEDAREAKEEPRRRPLTSALMVILLVGVPLGAVGLYFQLGQPQLEDQTLATRQHDLNQATEGRAEIARMITGLEQKLQANPEDANGWALLGRSYSAMGRMEAAVNAYTNLVTLTGRDPEAVYLLAETMIVAERGVVSQSALTLFEEIRAQDANDPRPYFYIGLERQQKGDAAGAINVWVDLLEHSPANARWVAEIKARIAAVAAEAALSVRPYTLLPPLAETVTQPEPTPEATGPSF